MDIIISSVKASIGTICFNGGIDLILLGVLGLIALVSVGIGYYSYKIAFFNNIKDEDINYVPKGEQYQRFADKLRTTARQMYDIPFEAVQIQSSDGLTLFGRYYHVEEGAPLQIQMHGYRGCAYRDFSGGHALARKMGHNVLVVDQRAHGRSQGHVISFGIMEREDCAAWVEYGHRRFGKETPIFLCGVSMGAATVLMASELPLKENVVGIIADCPYSSPKDIIIKVCADMKIPGKPAYPFVVLGGLLFGKFKLWLSSAREAVKHSKVPILLIHGEDDRFVPCEMGREIYAQNPDRITLETFPDAGHGMSYMVDTPRYEAAVIEFCRKCLENWCAE